MELYKQIGDYILYRRTDYSKLHLLDRFGNPLEENYENNKLADSIINDYILQENLKYEIFNIDGNKVISCNQKYKFENLFIPDDVTQISTKAFENMKIKRVCFPEHLESIMREAFYGCYLLKEINLPNILDNLHVESGVFSNCISLGRVSLSDKTKVIPRLMFCRCMSLRSVSFPSSLEIIGDGAFNGCVKLENIILPDSVQYIGNYSFADCDNLTELNIPNNLSSIGVAVIQNSGVKKITINHDMPHPPAGDYKDSMKDSKINKIEILSGVRFVDCHFFKQFKNIRTIDYLGNKSEFETFSKKSKDFLSLFPHAKINILGKDIKEMYSIIGNKDSIEQSR